MSNYKWKMSDIYNRQIGSIRNKWFDEFETNSKRTAQYIASRQKQVNLISTLFGEGTGELAYTVGKNKGIFGDVLPYLSKPTFDMKSNPFVPYSETMISGIYDSIQAKEKIMQNKAMEKTFDIISNIPIPGNIGKGVRLFGEIGKAVTPGGEDPEEEVIGKTILKKLLSKGGGKIVDFFKDKGMGMYKENLFNTQLDKYIEKYGYNISSDLMSSSEFLKFMKGQNLPWKWNR
jgi:hypothetical protein